MHGRGLYLWGDGRKYDGEYKEDKKCGFGIYLWSDGRCYEGFWDNGKQCGKGKYILPDGTKKMGDWDQGRRVCWVEGEEEKDLKPKYWDSYERPKLPN